MESTIPRLWRYPFKRNGKAADNSFVHCLVDDIKHHEKDVEYHEVRHVYRLGNKTVISWLFGGIDKTIVLLYRWQLDASLSSVVWPRATVHRAVHEKY